MVTCWCTEDIYSFQIWSIGMKYYFTRFHLLLNHIIIFKLFLATKISINHLIQFVPLLFSVIGRTSCPLSSHALFHFKLVILFRLGPWDVWSLPCQVYQIQLSSRYQASPSVHCSVLYAPKPSFLPWNCHPCRMTQADTVVLSVPCSPAAGSCALLPQSLGLWAIYSHLCLAKLE